MAKRSASTDLNHDNWNATDKKEDPGTFTPLNASQLQNRIIKKAKRSIKGSNSPAAASSPFAKFSGFTSSATSSPLFGSLSKSTSPFRVTASTNTPPFTASKETNTDATETNSSSSPFSTFKKIKEEPPNDSSDESRDVAIISEVKKPTGEFMQTKQSRGIEYCKLLKSLNESVLKWMQLHLAKNACSDFTPVFNDYKKHLDKLNMKYPVRKNEAALNEQVAGAIKKEPIENHSVSEEQPMLKIESKKLQEDETDYGAHFSSNTTYTSTFSFGIKATPTATSSNTPSGPNSSSKEGPNENNKEEDKKAPTFSAGFFSQNNKQENKGSSTFSPGFFGQNNEQENKGSTTFSAGFFSKGFSSDKPFSFGTAPTEKPAGGAGKDEEYVPPKNDFTAVSEEDAVYSKRCKLFFKKDEAFADKGVGTLYIKSLENSTQLLIRADTNLGNILLNIRLSASLPISRNGKNNVMIACVPNPPIDTKNPDKAIPILIRVKTSEDADELLETLNKYKFV